MKTHNWQTKALTLFIAVAALWLATACTEDSGLRIITPSAPYESCPLTLAAITMASIVSFLQWNSNTFQAA